MKLSIYSLTLALGLSPIAALADESLYAQDEHCFESAQSIYDICTKQARRSGGLNDENHHDCLSRYHQKIDNCLVPD